MAAAGCLFLMAVFASAQDDVSLDVSVNRNQIYTGESIILTVQVTGKESEPDLSGIQNAQITFLGSQSRSNYSFALINGRITKTGFSGRSYTYEVTPSKVGLFRAGPVTLSVSGRTISARGPTVEVSGVEEQGWVLVEVTASRQSVLVDEPFSIRLALLLRCLPEPYGRHDPLDPRSPPKLQAPFLNGGEIDGLSVPNIQSMLQGMMVARPDEPGWAINNYSVRRDPFDSFFNFGDMFGQEAARFRFPRRLVQRDGVPYFEYAVALGYVPKEEGSRTFGPAVFKGSVVVGIDAGGQIDMRPVFAVGPACTVQVVPPPEEDRPESFIGAIGSNLTVSATLDTQTCSVGDPLSLTLRVQGDISIDNTYPPPLGAQEALLRDFRIYEDTVQSRRTDEGREFTFTIRPIRAGTIELPPIEVSYYDIYAQAYRTVRTEPIPLRANKALEAAEDILIDTVTNRSATTAHDASAVTLVAAPITVVPAGAESCELVQWNRVLPLALAGPILFLAIFLGRLAVRSVVRWRHEDVTRGAGRRARSTLRAASRISAQDPPQARRILCSAIRDYAGDRFRASGAGMTPLDIRRVLARSAISDELAEALCEIVERNFNAGFGQDHASGEAVAADIARTEDILARIDRATRSRRVKRPDTAIAMCLAFWAMTAGAEGSLESRFLWDEANTIMASARTEQDFARAADAYERLIGRGIHNSPAFHNLGTALMKAQKPGPAVKALLRAERYTGTNDDIRRNLAISLAELHPRDTDPLPWHRQVLFWHYGLSAQSRVTVAAAAFSLFWIALALRTIGLRQLPRQLMVVALIVFAIFGSSSAATIHAEARDRYEWEWMHEEAVLQEGGTHANLP